MNGLFLDAMIRSLKGRILCNKWIEALTRSWIGLEGVAAIDGHPGDTGHWMGGLLLNLIGKDLVLLMK